jgi:hypothetical protein
MPMMPSPLAALTYGVVKVAGYALFGDRLNRYAQTPVRPVRFGLVKTAAGLAGGVLYVFLFMYFARDGIPDWVMFTGALPVRLFVWTIVIDKLYGNGLSRRTMMLAVLAGTAWSYVLDGVMALIYLILPGMVMPFC